MKRASSSLPVPLSPSTSTVALEGAACVAMSSTRRSAVLWPTISRAVKQLELLAQRAVLGDQRLALGGFAHRLDDRHALERLLDEVVRAFAHRLNRGLDRAVRGHQHDFDVRRQLFHRAEELDAVRARHHQVRQHDLDAMSSHELERQLRALRGEHAQPFTLQDLLQARQVARLVVDDEHGAVRRHDVRSFAIGREGSATFPDELS